MRIVDGVETNQSPSYRRSARFFPRVVLGAVLVLSLCGAKCGGSDDDGAVLVGSVWAFSGEFTYTEYSLATREPLGQTGPSRSQVRGQFRVTDELIAGTSKEKVDYRLEVISAKSTVAFDVPQSRLQFSGSNIVDECDAIGDEFTIEADPSRSGGSYSYYQNGEAFAPDMFGAEQSPTRLFSLQVFFTGVPQYTRRCTMRDVVYGFSYDEDYPFDVTLPFIWGALPVREGTFSVVRDQGTEPYGAGIIRTANLTLSCISGCDEARGDPAVDPAPEPKSEQCDPALLQQRCDEFRDGIETFCKTLEDWMIVQTDTGSGSEDPVITCETPDCADSIAANQSRMGEPWVGVTHSLDSACGGPNAGQRICSVECYGWAGFER